VPANSDVYIPCPVKSTFSSAFTLPGGAKFGNKSLYSQFAATRDAVYLQNPALVHTQEAANKDLYEQVSNVY